MRRILAPTCLAVAVLTGVVLGQDGRVTYLNNSGERRMETGVEITGETLDQVTWSKGSGQGSAPSILVLDVVYGTGSEAFEQGLAARDDGDVTNALSLLVAAKDDSDPAWVAPVALLELAETAAIRPDGLTQARSAIDEFTSRFSDHRRLPEALLARARYAAAAGDLPAAETAVAEVEALADSGRITADWRLRALLTQGEFLLAADDVRRANEVFAQAERAVTLIQTEIADRPDLQPAVDRLGLAARVGKGRCLLASDDVAGARAYYSELLTDGKDDPSIQAAAGNGLAECDFRAGQIKAAQLGFARVAIAAAASPDEHARSLYFLGRCAADLDASGAEPNGKARAMMYFQEVQKRYPNTTWAQQASQARP